MDMLNFFSDGSAVMEAVDYKYRYRLERTDGFEKLTFEQWDKVRSDVKDSILQIIAGRGMGFDDIKENRIHIIIDETCRRLGVKCYRKEARK